MKDVFDCLDQGGRISKCGALFSGSGQNLGTWFINPHRLAIDHDPNSGIASDWNNNADRIFPGHLLTNRAALVEQYESSLLELNNHILARQNAIRVCFEAFVKTNKRFALLLVHKDDELSKYISDVVPEEDLPSLSNDHLVFKITEKSFDIDEFPNQNLTLRSSNRDLERFESCVYLNDGDKYTQEIQEVLRFLCKEALCGNLYELVSRKSKIERLMTFVAQVWLKENASSARHDQIFLVDFCGKYSLLMQAKAYDWEIIQAGNDKDVIASHCTILRGVTEAENGINHIQLV
jgi:hypothetical protein